MTTEFIAQILRTSADGIAGLTAGRLFEQEPEGWVQDFSTWKSRLTDWVQQLAAAIQAQQPSGFGDHVAWSSVPLRAKGVPAQRILSALKALEEVAIESIPSGMSGELGSFFEAAVHSLKNDGGQTKSCLPSEEPMRSLASGFIAALRAGDEPRAIATILDAHAEQGQAVPSLVDQILIPSLREMGRLWHLGEATVAEEHFATQATHKVLARLMALAPKRPLNGKTALLSGVSGEDHSFGIQVVSGYLQMAGWRTVCLGSDTPPSALAQAVGHFDANVILLGATMDVQVHNVIEAIKQIREQTPSARVLVGGSAFARSSELWKIVGADHHAKDGQDAVRLASAY